MEYLIDNYKNIIDGISKYSFPLRLEMKLGYKVLFNHNTTVLEGIVDMINLKGCQVCSTTGQYFIKWCNIIKIIE